MLKEVAVFVTFAVLVTAKTTGIGVHQKGFDLSVNHFLHKFETNDII
jgi:hypothetical protein